MAFDNEIILRKNLVCYPCTHYSALMFTTKMSLWPYSWWRRIFSCDIPENDMSTYPYLIYRHKFHSSRWTTPPGILHCSFDFVLQWGKNCAQMKFNLMHFKKIKTVSWLCHSFTLTRYDFGPYVPYKPLD